MHLPPLSRIEPENVHSRLFLLTQAPVGIEGLNRLDILHLLDLAEEAVAVSRQAEKKKTRFRAAP